MSTSVMLIVLFAALLHASWNALVKSSPDTFLDIVFVTGSAGLLCAAIVPFVPLPDSHSWPYIAVSAAIHVAYFLLIGAAYRSGDMSHAYPLMRGAPPLLIALVSGPLIGERLGAGEWIGVLLICGGILGLLLVNRAGHNTRRTTRIALLNALIIATYTLVDGTGARLSGHAASYTMWMFVLAAPPVLIWAMMRRKAGAITHLRNRGYLMLGGGVCTLASYTLVLWAMTQAPIAMVAALRESAILFGTAISILVLKERHGYSRPVSALVILLGVVTLKLT
ncbi:DMT family transporter [Paraburkholderia rhizosphaerae]|uniref:Multidrug transporter EmrE-like cation transporter n=1 Tax=Paraburkholderia rhizosphaerae TaxID=480658 RepID=A0A4R8LA56_9BURK|nr:DMT family transporter [Paraburkholderia rhizosphaerae]TDY38840.1 multidrug transporter EmrE-like cation transporter [Paraburkholderia rhizosphaerae]